MPKVEIDETELMNYRNISNAVQKMLANPKTRTKILEAQKEINPDAIIPELDANKPVLEALNSIKSELDEVKKTSAADKEAAAKDKAVADMTRKWEAGRALARRAGYTEDGLQALEAFMEANGVADHKIAMPAFERDNPPQAPVEGGNSRFDVFGGLKNDGEHVSPPVRAR